MKRIAIFFLVATLIILVYRIDDASCQVVELDSKSLCIMRINSVRITNGKVYAHPEDLLPILERKKWIYAHSCKYLFATMSMANKPTEAQYIMANDTKVLPKNHIFANIPRRQMHIVLYDAVDFLTIYKGPKQKPPPEPSSGKSGDMTPAQEGIICEVSGELCISSNSEAEYTAECKEQELNVKLSTKGKFTISAKNEGASISLSVGGK